MPICEVRLINLKLVQLVEIYIGVQEIQHPQDYIPVQPTNTFARYARIVCKLNVGLHRGGMKAT